MLKTLRNYEESFFSRLSMLCPRQKIETQCSVCSVTLYSLMRRDGLLFDAIDTYSYLFVLLANALALCTCSYTKEYCLFCFKRSVMLQNLLVFLDVSNSSLKNQFVSCS